MSNFKNLVVTPTQTGSSSQLLAGCLYHVVSSPSPNGGNVLQLIPVLKTKDSQGTVTSPPVVNLHQPVRFLPASFPNGSFQSPANAQLVQQLGSANYIITTPTNQGDASKTIRVDNKLQSIQNMVVLEKPPPSLPSNSQTGAPSYILMNPKSPLPVKTIPLHIPAHTELKTIPASSLPIAMQSRIVRSNTSSDTSKSPKVIYVSPVKTLPASCKPMTSSITTTTQSSPGKQMLVSSVKPATAAIVAAPLKWVVQENPQSKSSIVPEKPNADTEPLTPPPAVQTKTKEPSWPVISSVKSLKDNTLVVCNNKVFVLKKKDSEVLSPERVMQEPDQLQSEKELANKVVEVFMSKSNLSPSKTTPSSGSSTCADRSSPNSNQMPSFGGSTRCHWSPLKSNQTAISGGSTRADWSSAKSNQTPSSGTSTNSNQMPSSGGSTRCDWSSPKSNQMPSSGGSTRCDWSSPKSNQMPSSGGSTRADRSSTISNQTPSSGGSTRCDWSSPKSNQTPSSGGLTRADLLAALRPKISTTPQAAKSIPEIIYIDDDDDDDDDDVQIVPVTNSKPKNISQPQQNQTISSKVCTPSAPVGCVSLGSDNQHRVMAHTGNADITVIDETPSSSQGATMLMKSAEHRVMAHTGVEDIAATMVRDVTTSSWEGATMLKKFTEHRVMVHTGAADIATTVRAATPSSSQGATMPMKSAEHRVMVHTGAADIAAIVRDATPSSSPDATVPMKSTEHRVMVHTGAADIAAIVRDATTSSRQCPTMLMKFTEVKEKEADVTKIAATPECRISDRSLRKKFGLVRQEKIILSRVPPLQPQSQSDSGSGEVTVQVHTESQEKRKSSFSETSNIPKRRKSADTCDVNMNAVPEPLAGDIASSSTSASAGSSHTTLTTSGERTDISQGLNKSETNGSCGNESSSHSANHTAPETSPNPSESPSFFVGEEITGYFSEAVLPRQRFHIEPSMYPDETAKDEKIQRLKEMLREREQALEVLRRQKWS